MTVDATFLLIVGCVAVLAGAVASVTGFGIGSLLTPLFAWQVGIRTAVPLVALPHLAATALRFWRLRAHIDRKVLVNFGILSALGGLAGALLHQYVPSVVLTAVLGVLLILAGAMGLSGLADRFRFQKRIAWLAGLVSGILGGLVGNQGGLRSAALLGFDLRKEAFIATATATGLIVDGARTPVYLALQWHDVASNWGLVAVGICGALAGTLAGESALRQIPEAVFRRVISAVLLVLGVLVFLLRSGES